MKVCFFRSIGTEHSRAPAASAVRLRSSGSGSRNGRRTSKTRSTGTPSFLLYDRKVKTGSDRMMMMMLPLPRGMLPPRRRRRCIRSLSQGSAARGCTNPSAAPSPSRPASVFSSGAAHRLRVRLLLPHPPVDSPLLPPPGGVAGLLHPWLFSRAPLPLHLHPWSPFEICSSRRSGAALRAVGG